MTTNVWLVYFDVVEHLLEIVLTYRRSLPSGDDVKFDEDVEPKLNVVEHEDDHLVMDGFLALFEDGLPLSCALRAEASWLGLVKREVFAVHCNIGKAQLADALGGTLYNPDSSADFFFAGGSPDEHTPELVNYAALRLKKSVETRSDYMDFAVLQALLDRYSYVAYTQTTEINVFTPYSDLALVGSRHRLAAAAAKYGFVVSS